MRRLSTTAMVEDEMSRPSLFLPSSSQSSSAPTSSFSSFFRKSKRQRPNNSRDTATKVHFAQYAMVCFIENAHSDYSPEEKQASFYTRHELDKQRRLAHQLASTMEQVYEDDGVLWDRFGVQTLSRQRQRHVEVCQVHECVMRLQHYESGMMMHDEDDDEMDTDALQQTYRQVTEHSASLAQQRALRLEKQLSKLV
mmetsp:Transcript_18437/g.29728  ORF Transcript_18437/g.29728 Transcript_18437/m.29728 type:complete len:196 (+) Transcript_18437:606-1193(+)